MLGKNLIRGSPQEWQSKVKGILADMGYDGEEFVFQIKQKWKHAKVGIPVKRTHKEVLGLISEATVKNRKGKEGGRTLNRSFLNKRSEIERYFSRKKRVFKLGEERTRHLKNFHANCYLTSIMEILEWMSGVSQLFTRLKLEIGRALFSCPTFYILSRGSNHYPKNLRLRGEICYIYIVLVGVSPVQLRISKAEGRHTKKRP